MNALKAQERAHEMARKYVKNLVGVRKWIYSIKDNPYHQKHPMHTVWHNAFYDERKVLNRRIK